jgi:hypothetical protein
MSSTAICKRAAGAVVNCPFQRSGRVEIGFCLVESEAPPRSALDN